MELYLLYKPIADKQLVNWSAILNSALVTEEWKH